MVTPIEDKWKAWNEERQRFRCREPQDFEEDLKIFRAHIAKLNKLAPKDSAGRPVLPAWEVIQMLLTEWSQAMLFGGYAVLPNASPYD